MLETVLHADFAAELDAGFGAGDVEVARALCIANAHIFNRLRLGDDSVGGTCAGYSNDNRCRTQKKALDCHFVLTSSQSKRKDRNHGGSDPFWHMAFFTGA
jgi:hypothetical protein